MRENQIDGMTPLDQFKQRAREALNRCISSGSAAGVTALTEEEAAEIVNEAVTQELAALTVAAQELCLAVIGEDEKYDGVEPTYARMIGARNHLRAAIRTTLKEEQHGA